MAVPMVVNFPAANSTYLYAVSVAGGGAGLVPLAIPYPVVFKGIARPITLTSTDNLSAINFTIVGTDQFGNPISEVLAGPNNNTVHSVNSYNTISSITASGAYTNFSAGTYSTGYIQWIPMNYQNNTFNATIQVVIAGTINYSLYQTLDRMRDYQYVGGTVTYNGSQSSVQLSNNPLATTSGSAVVTVTVPSTASLTTGQFATINSALAVGGITAAQLNITAQITVASGTTFTYVSNGMATSTVAGGGGNAITYQTPPYPTSFPITAALTTATTNEIYTTVDPCVMIGGTINSSSAGGTLTLTILQQGV